MSGEQPRKQDAFAGLPKEAFDEVEPLSQRTIKAALDAGRDARRAVEAETVLPIVPAQLRFR